MTGVVVVVAYEGSKSPALSKFCHFFKDSQEHIGNKIMERLQYVKLMPDHVISEFLPEARPICHPRGRKL